MRTLLIDRRRFAQALAGVTLLPLVWAASAGEPGPLLSIMLWTVHPDLPAVHGGTLLVECLDPEEAPAHYLTKASEACDIVRKVASPRVRFLYDFYHEQISEGDLIARLDANIDLVEVAHIADVLGPP